MFGYTGNIGTDTTLFIDAVAKNKYFQQKMAQKHTNIDFYLSKFQIMICIKMGQDILPFKCYFTFGFLCPPNTPAKPCHMFFHNMIFSLHTISPKLALTNMILCFCYPH